MLKIVSWLCKSFFGGSLLIKRWTNGQWLCQNVETLLNLTKDCNYFILLSIVSFGYFGLTFTKKNWDYLFLGSLGYFECCLKFVLPACEYDTSLITSRIKGEQLMYPRVLGRKYRTFFRWVTRLTEVLLPREKQTRNIIPLPTMSTSDWTQSNDHRP